MNQPKHPILRLRQHLDLTQRELSELTGVCQHLISYYERWHKRPLGKNAMKFIVFANRVNFPLSLDEFYPPNYD